MLEGKKRAVIELLDELDNLRMIMKKVASKENERTEIDKCYLRLKMINGKPGFRKLLNNALENYKQDTLEELARHGLELRGEDES